MAIIVEHNKRKREILDKALDIFIEEGYEDATFQKISDRCGITRTTLYIYFKNKREIFVYSIKQLSEDVEASLLEIANNKNLSTKERLSSVLHTVLDKCSENRKLFTVALSYLMQLKKTGKDPAIRVRRRILRLRHLLSSIIIEGKESGEFRSVNVKEVNDLFFSIIEASIFKLSILDQKTLDESHNSINLSIAGILA
ncbi:MAG: TetR/AcrR family transcriptional regulator [Spirochaetaceae bacterium]|nr:TetR/AcrR family transcriptional regulator [Spirochaetaceae bacterium]MBO5236821.1 TetR/AcrR family transcriptional regulator [Spirochaetaceae bacterium]